MPDLPPVEERFVADATQYIAALEAMAAAAERAARAQAQIVAGIEAMNRAMDEAAAGAEEAARADEAMAEAEDAVGRAGMEAAAGASAAADAAREQAAAAAAAAAADAQAAAAGNAAAGAASRMAAADTLAANQARVLSEAVMAQSAAQQVAAETATRLGMADTFLGAAMTNAERDALGLSGALVTAAAANDVAAASQDRVNRGLGVGIGFLRFGIGNWQTFAHWVIAGSLEFLAVAVPALVALGSGLLVAMQGAQNAQQHFQALYAATESTANAMHTTVGDVLGLGHALQTAQDQANPGVYEVLGSVVNDMKTRFADFAGAGLQVVHMFDEFAARVTVDLQGALGGQIQGLLAGMVGDLQQFGQVLGNIGHALLNFASDMPGLAHVLLTLAVVLSEVIMWASRGGVFFTFAMALEETFRWGGLLLGILVRITGQMSVMNAMGATNFITRFGAALLTLVSLGGRVLIWAGQMIGRLAGVSEAFGTLGTSMAEAGAGAATFAEEMSPAMAAGIAGIAAAVIFLVAKLASMKTATEQWIAQSDQMVAKASDLTVLPTVYGQLEQTTVRLAASQDTLTRSFAGVESRYNGLAGMTTHASTASVDLANHLLSLVATANTVRGNINLLAGVFHTSQIGALALANAAGVNLQQGLTAGSEAAKIAVMQINNLKAGLGAMHAPATEIGADMEAVGVQSQLASSKVQQVNQAMDAFVAGTTGGMDIIMQFNGQLQKMGHDGAASSMSITGAINSISASAQKMGYTLSGIGPKSQQSWQQFDAAVVNANSVLDTFRTGMAEGVVTQQQYTQEINAVGGALLPFAAKNRTALAIVSQISQETGGPATTNLRTLANEFGVTGRKAQEMATSGMEKAVARMANLNTVARNLSATISTQLDTAMASAIVKASRLDSAYTKWANDVKNNKGPQTLAGDLKTIRQAQDFVNTATQKATTLMNNSSKAASNLGSSMNKAAADTATATAKTTDHVAALGTATARTIEATGKTTQLSGQLSQNASVTQHASSAAQAAAQQVQHLGSVATQTRAQVGDVNNEIRTMSGVAGNGASAMARIAASFEVAGGHASSAAGQVRGLASAIAALQSKTITIQTNMVTTHSTRAAGGPVVAGLPYLVGEQGQEMFVPAQSGFIVPHTQTQQILAATTPARSDTVDRPIVVELHHTTHVQAAVDQGVLFEATKTETARYGMRNSGTGQLGVLAPAGR